MQQEAWAIVLKGTEDIPYTSAPEMLGGGSIYQVYTSEADAKAFCRVPFADATYEVRPCIITITN